MSGPELFARGRRVGGIFFEQRRCPVTQLRLCSRRSVIVACYGMEREALEHEVDDGCGARGWRLVSRLKAWKNDLPRLKMGIFSQPERALRERMAGFKFGRL